MSSEHLRVLPAHCRINIYEGLNLDVSEQRKALLGFCFFNWDVNFVLIVFSFWPRESFCSSTVSVGTWGYSSTESPYAS